MGQEARTPKGIPGFHKRKKRVGRRVEWMRMVVLESGGGEKEHGGGST